MTAPVAPFLDSNILLYSYSNDPKALAAKGITSEPFAISVQVLNEFANVSRRKQKLHWDTLQQRLTAIVTLAETIVPLSMETHLLGIEVARRYRLQLYDSMIVAAALIADCETLLSEDMHHGLVIEDRLTIRNPFA